MTERRELYRSPSGDAWFLGREPTDGCVSACNFDPVGWGIGVQF